MSVIEKEDKFLKFILIALKKNFYLIKQHIFRKIFTILQILDNMRVIKNILSYYLVLLDIFTILVQQLFYLQVF